MLSKEILRKKFSSKRKKKYFEVEENFFLPLLKIIRKNNFKKIALYYSSNYEVNTLKLFKLIIKKKNFQYFFLQFLINQ